MIDAQIDNCHALIHVVSGSLDVTYEIRAEELWARPRRSSYYTRTGKNGYVFDLVGSTRDPLKGQAPYIFAGLNFESVLLRAMSKARHLERLWRNTRSRQTAGV